MDYIQKTIELHNHFGKNDNYVQAAGGNISIKDGDIIHIKKSGLSFKDIKDKNDIISLNISKEEMIQEVLSIKNKQNLENQYNEFINQKNPYKERPSIELSFHIFGDKYTLHLHPTLINIFTCTEEGQEIIKKICEENDNMSYVDYYKPGIILTDAILQERSTLNDITFLFNHGIIITGPSEKSIKDRYKSVEEILKREIIYEEHKHEGPFFDISATDEYILEDGDGTPQYDFLINDDFIDTVNRYKGGKDLLKRHTQARGTSADNYMLHLYPDSAIYNAFFRDQGDDEHFGHGWSGWWIMFTLNKKDATFQTELFFNKMKIIHFAKLNGFTPCYLDEESVDELVNWDAEKYRQDLLK